MIRDTKIPSTYKKQIFEKIFSMRLQIGFGSIVTFEAQNECGVVYRYGPQPIYRALSFSLFCVTLLRGLKSFEMVFRQALKPSLNTQSYNRRPLCSAFTFQNVPSPKKTQLYSKKKIICSFLVWTLQCFQNNYK